MKKSSLGHRSTTTLLYSADHGQGMVLAVRSAQALQVLLPGLVVWIADPAGWRSWLRGWIVAADQAARIWPDADGSEPITYTPTGAEVITHLRITGTLPPPRITGMLGRVSPSGRGRLILRVDQITMIFEHGGAWLSHWETWQRAHRAAHDLWPSEIPPLDRVIREERHWARRPATKRQIYGG